MSNYIFEYKRQQFTPDGRIDTGEKTTEDHNAEIEARHLELWQAKPDEFAGYVVDGKFTTWLGTELGRVYHQTPIRTCVGSGKLTHYRIRGNNGESYYGRHGNMQLLRVRRFK